jgi:hypothetical protein
MEAIVQTMNADNLAPIMQVPKAMRHKIVQVIVLEAVLRQPEDEDGAESSKPKVNQEMMKKFLDPQRHEEFVQHLKSKVAAGVCFDFDAQKIIDGTMTDADVQEYGKSLKQGWTKAVKDMAARGKYGSLQ